MEISIKYTNIQPSVSIKEYVEKKIQGLETLVKFIEEKQLPGEKAIIIRVEVGKTTKHHKEGRIWYGECQLDFPGKTLRASSTHYELNAAIDEAISKMKELLRAYKETIKAKR